MSTIMLMQNYIKQRLGRNIRLFRQKRGLSRRVFSERAGMSETYAALLENGKGYPSAGLLEQIAEVLGVSVSRLYADDGEVFSSVTREQWTEFQQRLETISICTGACYEFCVKPNKAQINPVPA